MIWEVQRTGQVKETVIRKAFDCAQSGLLDTVPVRVHHDRSGIVNAGSALGMKFLTLSELDPFVIGGM